jgi:hypothetical protein
LGALVILSSRGGWVSIFGMFGEVVVFLAEEGMYIPNEK